MDTTINKETQQTLSVFLMNAIDTGRPLYNEGKKKECFETYLDAAKLACDQDSVRNSKEVAQLLESAVEEALLLEQERDFKNGAWVLRRCFDDVRKEPGSSTLVVVVTKDDMTMIAAPSPLNQDSEEMESLSQLLKRTINEGAPIYNKGKQKECFELYLDVAQFASEQESLQKTAVRQLLQQAIDESIELETRQEWAEGAWVLRHAFDEILNKDKDTQRRARLLVRSISRNDSSTVSSDYWQDAAARNTTDLEKGQCIADIAYVLRASITPKQHTRFTKTFEDCFQASEAVEVLTSLGLAGNRKMAADKCNMMLAGSLILSVSHENETSFKDGTRLYRFSDREEIQAKYDDLLASDPAEGSDDAVLLIALQATLEVPSLNDEEASDEPATFSGVSTAHLRPRRHSQLSKEQAAGEELALLAANYEKLVEIKDRKYNFKTYESCFVGNEAVSTLVNKKLAKDRKEATATLEQLLQVNLIHHVTREHSFEDKNLFYRFTPVADIKKSIDIIAALPTTPAGHDLVRYTALVQRYKQFAGLNVTSILNIFFGCEDESGWDLVDLENWRHNMKRWGFGRRNDQDDDMVDRLAPLCANVNPDEWDVAGDEEWESPYGILAQIAIFDQIPRSAFRGTSDAFKWDELAIRATKVAIEKGYFETAFKSTLNQFLLLLPLEHSESWEDQKLGVTLLLQLLSTVAVEDKDLSDYEIVKRLEFSKRLATAFLEHAQVIAKFKRYPHRNRPQGRTTTLEERIWLASDLVPRWAKSQSPDDARNVIQLPVIPLKRLTRK
jgi:uncharacterized protein (DUF924 family)